MLTHVLTDSLSASMPRSVKSVMLATGFECSYPTVQHGKRRDELEGTRHYECWREDFELCKHIGAQYVRYGLPYYSMHVSAHQYNWSWADQVLPVMRDMGLVPILDLCHFGVPDWVGGFQNTDWPELFADYAEACVIRYPWIRYFTPVNELLVCARFSGKQGIWNEQETSDKAMVTAHANMCRATLLSIERILKHRPDAVFFQSEAAEQVYERSPEARDKVAFLNQLRYITFDFLYGHPPDADILYFLMDQGMTRKTFEWFMQHGKAAAPHCVMGMDYYKLNERVLHPDGSQQGGVGPVLGWANIARQYFQRYHMPMMLTETNTIGTDPTEAVNWLWSTWHNVEYLREEGIPVLGYTWYSLTDQIDWDIQLRRIEGHVDPVGLYKLDRTPRDVASAFQQLCTRYGSLPLLADFPEGSMGAVDNAGSDTDADQRRSSDAATRRERRRPAEVLSTED